VAAPRSRTRTAPALALRGCRNTGRKAGCTEQPERDFTAAVPALAPTPESSGETEVPSDMVGELVMEALSTPDQVAYIRFTSVYRNFREAKDLGEFLGRIAPDEN
jgi:transcriptional regulator NrdR family protein